MSININQTFLLQRVYYIFSTSVKRMKIYALTSDWLVIEMILGSKKKLKEIFWSTPDFGSTLYSVHIQPQRVRRERESCWFSNFVYSQARKKFHLSLSLYISKPWALSLSLCTINLLYTSLSLCTIMKPAFVFVNTQGACLCLFVQSNCHYCCVSCSRCFFKFPLYHSERWETSKSSPKENIEHFQSHRIHMIKYCQVWKTITHFYAYLVSTVYLLDENWCSISWWSIIARYSLLNKFWK